MKKKRSDILRTMIFMASCAIVLSACATTQMTGKDTAIETSMRESYPFRTYLQSENTSVHSQNGKVTLSGTVPDASYKYLAEDLAGSISGVESINNQMEPEGGTPQEGSDAWLGAKVKADLMMHPGMNPDMTEIYVNKGIVTLRGQADNEAQRELTAEYAKNVKGVKEVVNDITVAEPIANLPQTYAPKTDDASITAQVNTALTSNRSTSDLDAAVETHDGIVSVEGTADNQAQKDLVTNIVIDMPGVRAVNNDLSVPDETGATNVR